MNLVIVIPTYNEKDNIQPLVKQIFEIVPEAKILIVDDNSPDGTGRVADELADKYSQLCVLHRVKKEGLGKAYIAGFKEALKMNADYIIQMDADFSHDPRYIPELLEKIQTCDLVIGSRFMDKSKRPANISNLSILANQYSRLVLGLRISDPLGGFKCFKQILLEEIDLDKFISDGFIFQAEFIYRAFKKGSAIKETAIRFNKRKTGKTKKSIKIILEAFFKVIMLRLTLC
jgi:dolichol-phosphate mannosyltransferase